MPGVKLATAYYELIPSMGGNQAAISSQMGVVGQASGKKFGSGFSGAAKSAMKLGAGLAVGAAAINFVKGSIAEAREAQKVGAQTAQVIKTTGGAANVSAKQVATLSNAISKKTGIDDEAVQSGANLLLTFTDVQNQAGKGNDIFNQATAAVQDMAVAFHQDAGGAAKQLGKALNDPVKGVTALNRVGVQFTAEQKKQIKTLVETGDKLGAQKIILAEIKKESAGSAAAQATAGDKMRVSWGNFQETVGTKLVPVLDKMFAGLSKVLNFITAHQSVMVALGIVVGVVLVGALVAATVAVWSFTVALLANPLVWIVIAIIALVVVIVLLIKHWDLVKAKMIAVWNAIKSATAKAWDAIKKKFADGWTAIKNGVTAVKTWITDKWNAVLNFFRGLPGKIGSAVRGMWDGLKDAFRSAINWIIGKWNGLKFGIPDFTAFGKHINGFSIGTPNIPLLAQGGIVTRPTLAMIGEAGAEAVVPLNRLDQFGGGNRPIRTDSGVLLGWLREVANHEMRIFWNEQAFAAGVSP